MSPTALKTEAQPDRNYYSLTRDGATWFAGTPDVRDAVPPYDGMQLVPEEPKAWETAFKCSGRTDTHLNDLVVAQCKENALDCNNGTAHCSFSGDWGWVGNSGEQVFTIKGGSHHIVLVGAVYSCGTRADLFIGAWSDQSTEVSQHLDAERLTLSRARPRQPFTVILCRVNQPWLAWVGRAPKDIKLPEGARVLKLKSLGAQIHWVAKLAAVKLGLIKGRRPQETLS